MKFNKTKTENDAAFTTNRIYEYLLFRSKMKLLTQGLISP